MADEFKIFVTGENGWIRGILEGDGFLVLDRDGGAPGEDLSATLKSADLVLLVHRGDSTTGTFERPASWEFDAFRRGQADKGLVGIPVLFGDVPEGWKSIFREASDRRPILLKNTADPLVQMLDDEAESRNRSTLLQAVRRLRKQAVAPASSVANPSVRSGSLLCLQAIELTNIGCFESLKLSFDRDWVTILGDNAAGKSTLLRSLILGLCTENEAAALTSELRRMTRRFGANEGRIDLQLVDPVTGTQFRIITTILPGPKGDDEAIHKKMEPKENFPWDRLFVCAYGTSRSREAKTSYEEYALLEAVKTFFNDSALLQNPELILLRQQNGFRRDLESRSLKIMMLERARFEYSGRGLTIRSEWGEQPIQSLSDGYRTTLQWVLDFCAWAIYAGRFGESGVDGGILLIDELEQHLHPRWQRHIVKLLRQQFPNTQIVVSTHTPLVAAGVADLDSGQIVRLEENVDGAIESLIINPKELWGLRADQILTSEAFGLVTSSNVESETALDRYAALLGKPQRSELEEAEFQELRKSLRETLSLGQTQAEREAERIVERVLDEITSGLDKEQIGFEARQLLQEILRPERDS